MHFYALIAVLISLQHFTPSLSLGFDNKVSSGVALGHGDASGVAVRCIEREREALLAFKQGLVDEYNQLTSWGSPDCCTWEGVFCSNQTKGDHVIKLDLLLYDLQGKTISPKLIELQHLKYLSLYGIDFNGSQIPDFIGSLSNLRYLDLSDASFGGRIPSQLGNLSHLLQLNLAYNHFATNVVQNLNSWLPRLSSLTHLDLSYNNLNNTYDWLEAINKLPKLRDFSLRDCSLHSPPMPSILFTINSSKYLAHADFSLNRLTSSSIFVWLSTYSTSLVYLDLIGNNLTGWSPHSFARLCSLRSLVLRNNRLSGQFSQLVQILMSACSQNSLKFLDLSYNHLVGPFPNLIKFLSLKDLDLSGNQISGIIPETIGKMSELESIDLSMNHLEGVISESHFSRLARLKYLDLSFNSLVLNFHSDWIPPFQLDYIILVSCKVGPNFPRWLQTQNFYSRLDISNAGIFDILPSWFWGGMSPNLAFMNLSHNQIGGTILANLTLEFAYSPQLHLSSNKLEGPIPSFLSQASFLDLSNNNFSGPITWLCAPTATSLTFLNLSSNNLYGQLPDFLTYLDNLVMLDLSYNALSGKIPATIGSLFRMETLKLRSNRFLGELPSSLKNCTGLRVIDLGNNTLSGPIPKWLGVSFQDLIILMLSSNHFNGSMPSQLCRLSRIQILDFSMNISGGIPKCLNNLTTLAQKGNPNMKITHYYEAPEISDEYEDDAAFIWKGSMQVYRNTLALMKRIDFSSNRLIGEIPEEISHLVGLVSLNLSRNRLTGHITPDIGKLQSLDALDLSRNQLDGRIPTSLSRIDRLGVLDLSYNNLFGEIPIGTQLQSFDPSTYAGNPQLCGPPLQKPCIPEKTDHLDQNIGMRKEEEKGELISKGFYICAGLGFFAGFWGVCGSLIFIRSWRYAYINFLNVLDDWFYVRIALIRQRWMLKPSQKTSAR
ncbi:receptor-like protein EIX2 [Pyrus communis]|uniref:receptor-like protein EIX2 n=1 Tax=Pyrus communis TaxID=23211 RepID=UPI0035BFC7E5